MTNEEFHYHEHLGVFLELASNLWVRLLEYTTRADREIISRNAYEKAQITCKYLQLPPAGVKDIYDYLWSTEVMKAYDAIAEGKGAEVNKYWYMAEKSRNSKRAIFAKPAERPQGELEEEVVNEFKGMYDERVRKGYIRE